MKLCKDCKYCDVPDYHKGKKYLLFGPMVTRDYTYAKCSAEFALDKVSGRGGVYCETARKYEPCGEKGKLWEAKHGN